MIVTSLLAAIVPMTFYLVFLWKFDKYEPEPLKLVLFHFLWGASAAIILGIIGSKLVSIPLQLVITVPEKISLLQIIFVAPLIEELSKGALLFKTKNDRRFDNLIDGLVYGGAIGLGFGMTENFLYFITFGDSLQNLLWLIVIRSGFSAVMHGMATAAFGALLSVSKYSEEKSKKLFVVAGLLIAVSIHFIWNFSVSFSNTFLFGLFFIVVIVGIFITVFIFALKFEKQIIKDKLSNEIPEIYIPILTSTVRSRKGWFTENYRKEFISKSIKLAFRKHELEISIEKKELYIVDVKELRFRVNELLKLNNKEKKSI